MLIWMYNRTVWWISSFSSSYPTQIMMKLIDSNSNADYYGCCEYGVFFFMLANKSCQIPSNGWKTSLKKRINLIASPSSSRIFSADARRSFRFIVFLAQLMAASKTIILSQFKMFFNDVLQLVRPLLVTNLLMNHSNRYSDQIVSHLGLAKEKI